MKLITSLTSPYGRKVSIVLAEKRIECQVMIASPWEEGTIVTEYNPLGKVPVLILDDGKPVYDSRVIVDYLDQVSPVGRLIPSDHRQGIRAKRWEALADGIIDAATVIVQERKRPPRQRSSEWIARQQDKIDRGLEQLSIDLADRKWCMGDSYCLADIAVGCLLGYLEFRFPEHAWADTYPNLAALYARLNERQAFVETRPVEPVPA
ncbi:glutathione S-transferase [Chitiniphilus shinanonensis]|uniref:Glutathione S-transferase n=1 Tax=Chitiniphilus shinanonensis TaxID=553088 RepID=A0ABQ6BWS4_9NEIS|nr:glutathione S-transferase [Chitiniphilus shinanonensis]GLS06149.1 glutathione S-transferase [Chitiniphilus shinanonensis]